MARLKILGWTQLKLDIQLGVKQGTLSQILAGTRPVPEGRVEAWADALGFTGLEREVFLDAALLTRCPQRIQELVARLQAPKPKGRRNR